MGREPCGLAHWPLGTIPPASGWGSFRDNSLRTLIRPTPSIGRSNFPDQWNDLKWLVSQRQNWLQSGSWHRKSRAVSCTYNWMNDVQVTEGAHTAQPLSAAFRWCAREHKSQKPRVYFQELQRLCSESVVLTQFSSVAQSCPTLCDPMDCITPGLPVHHQLPEFTQTHVHWVGDAIQPSHSLLSPFPPAFNLSHHQGLFQWVSSSHQVAKVLEFQLQHQSIQRIFRTDFL